MHEVEIERLAKNAGQETARRLDTDRVVQRVLGRLRGEELARRPVRVHPRPLRWLKVATVAVLLVVGGLVVRETVTAPESDAGFPVPLAWEELNAEDWNEVLDSLTYHAPVHDYVATTLYDLNEEQLRELLNQMES